MSESDAKTKAAVIRNKTKIAERQVAKGRGLASAQALGSGPTNRHGMPQLPPGQHEVKDWPVLDLGEQPVIAKEDWRLAIGGLCQRPLQLSWQDFMDLPQVDDVSDFHCVTTWSRMDNHWQGVKLSTVLEQAQPTAAVAFLLLHAYDGYTTNIPLAEAIKSDVLLVHSWQGQPLSVEHGGPCRLITPQLYAWKGAKWINKIELSEKDQPGFWETRGYSNSALPWSDDRYSGDEAPEPII